MNRIYQGRVSKVETSFSASDGEKVAKPDRTGIIRRHSQALQSARIQKS